MVALVAPSVLAASLALLGLFIVGWYHQFGVLPPVRATAVVAVGAFLVAFSVASLAELFEEPVESVAVVAGALLLVAATRHAIHRIRA